MADRPRGVYLIVAENFNVDLEGTDIWEQDEEIAAEIATAGLEDLEGHFLPRRRAWCKDQRN